MPDDAEAEGTPEKILRAAIEIIERDGVDKATVRSIAMEAGVNIAAINYHYRTKEFLMEAAIVATWEHAVGDMRAFLDVEPGKIDQGIEALALYLLQGGHRFPNVTKAHFFGSGTRPAPEVVLVSYRNFVKETAGRVCFFLGLPCDFDAIARTAAFLASILFSAFVPESLPEDFGRDDFAPTATILSSDYLANMRAASGMRKA